MFWFSLAFSWKRWCCCCWLLWLPFATIETCVNRILTSIMLISSRARKANGYLISQWVCVCMVFIQVSMCVCGASNVSWIFVLLPWTVKTSWITRRNGIWFNEFADRTWGYLSWAVDRFVGSVWVYDGFWFFYLNDISGRMIRKIQHRWKVFNENSFDQKFWFKIV